MEFHWELIKIADRPNEPYFQRAIVLHITFTTFMLSKNVQCSIENALLTPHNSIGQLVCGWLVLRKYNFPHLHRWFMHGWPLNLTEISQNYSIAWRTHRCRPIFALHVLHSLWKCKYYQLFISFLSISFSLTAWNFKSRLFFLWWLLGKK